MQNNEHKPTNEFLDLLVSNSYLTYIIQPSQHSDMVKHELRVTS